MILLYFNVVQLGLGGLLLNDFVTVPQLGILIGMVAAISEAVVVTLIYKGTTPVSKEGS